ncbi:cryptochrome/photolyase family protein [Chryseolinea lacunae]|uniref:Cryptochrome/photolyase family protein n=1 Tax=Chryseolinea lacunae TaxID=2801331 RepID=A0ABS1KKG2_9BACT|nr:cryptochrome/photolyase family protein [Chryseolinea lacunae]MBL0739944.1 cryptochrome/photolyase family protein [Chryseolinea lacunae]
MSSASLIFPHQLVEDSPVLQKGIVVYLVEEFLFFSQYRFHQQKIHFHRASMKAFQARLLNLGHRVVYVESHQAIADIRLLIPHLFNVGVTEIQYCDTTDYWLEKRIAQGAAAVSVKLTRRATPLFLTEPEVLRSYFDKRENYLQNDFYIHQRKRLQVLLDTNGKPLGGKWSFDAENRLKYPKGKTPPRIASFPASAHAQEADEYVRQKFSHHYGRVTDIIPYPVTHDHARTWFEKFLETRFSSFGPYEDAIVRSEHVLHHSVLTPMLNTGLLSPRYVLDTTLRFARENNVPLNSCEGFVRQLIGWREFVRGVYEHKGGPMRTRNFWGFTRKIPLAFWQGTTGIEPVDNTIRKVLDTGYCHHIERLMILGNFMLLCEFDPDEVYRWFMEMFIDAYDWVMVPNVYGMSQFADGGLLATKPYISGSNYVLKMSDYQKGPWQSVWDGLFWRFMNKQRQFFSGNPRIGMLVKTFDNFDPDKQRGHIQVAENFLSADCRI